VKFSWVYLFLICFIASCKSYERKTEKTDFTGFIEKKIVLKGIDSNYDQKDTLGFLSIMVPQRLDSFYQWHRTSDCTSCGWLQYRFGDKRYEQFEEAGFFWSKVLDSTYQLTIRHKPLKEIPDSITLKPFNSENINDQWLHQINTLSLSEKSVNYLFKEYKLINKRPFIVSAYSTSAGYLTQTNTMFIIASTALKDRYLFFIGECSAKDTVGFIKDTYKSFLSIKIEEK
jgi:hypothetical protein